MKFKTAVKRLGIAFGHQTLVLCLSVVVVYLSCMLAAYADFAKSPVSIKAAGIPKTVPKPKSVSKPAPAIVSTPPPAPSTPAPVSPKPQTSVPVSTSANVPKPEPVVTPSPSSSVSNLSPAPTQTSGSSPSSSSSTSTGPSSGSSGSGSQSSGSTGSSSPPTTNQYTSTNWSGYMATVGNFTAISGDWIVPTASSPGAYTSADASWIGIGGVSSNDLIQVGTANTVSSNGTVTTSAFYELLPDASINIPSLVVNAGDSIVAAITEQSANQWLITITDKTTSTTYSTTVAYTSSNSSAEWIEEDPSTIRGNLIPLDNFGTVNFSNGQTTSSGATESILGANAAEVTMVNNSGQPEGVPSALEASGSSFSVQYK